MAGRHVILNTPTGSGKSLVALAMHFRALCRGERAYYTSPIKALVSEKFFDLCRVFGAERVGMLTGDAALNHDAPIICCTAEVLANVALREGSDRQGRLRGARRVPLLRRPRSRHRLADPAADAAADHVHADVGHARRHLAVRTRAARADQAASVALVKSDDRPVPLEFSYSETPIHETIERLVEAERAPVYVVNFTQREAAELAQALT